MGTQLEKITGTNGEDQSEITVNVFCGHSKLADTNGTRLCVQLTPAYGERYSFLNMNAVKELIRQLESVVDGTYAQFEEKHYVESEE